MTTKAFVDAMLEVAEGEVGIMEAWGNNDGRVVKYLDATGRDPGDPYCASFIVWCAKRAATLLGLVNVVPVTAGALKLYERSPSWAKVPRAVPGAVGVLDAGQGRGHVWIVTGTTPTHEITIEANTRDQPDEKDPHAREGQGVFRRSRRHGEANVGWLLFDMDEAERLRSRNRVA